MTGMAKWERLEAWLWDKGVTSTGTGTTFTAHELAADLKISRSEASHMIQCYLGVMLNPKINTLFVLTRRGRTRNAVWHVGARVSHVKGLATQTVDDILTRFTRVVEPTLQQVGKHNPKAIPVADALMEEIRGSIDELLKL